MKKILLVNFSVGATTGVNHGVAIISSILKRKGCQVDMLFICEDLDYPFDLATMREDVLKLNPDLIALSFLEPQIKYVEEFCRDLKHYFSGLVVCGGAGPTMVADRVLAIDGVDIVCVGEGEEAISELMDAVQCDTDYRTIQNLWIKEPDGSITKNQLRPFIDLRTLPPEDYELFDLDKILPLKGYQLGVLLGRGCLHKCSYCINDGYLRLYEDRGSEKPETRKRYVRVKDVSTAIKEIKDAIRKHPQITKIAFGDDNVLFYGEAGKLFFERYKEEIGLPFRCNGSPALFTPSKGLFLKETGCVDIGFGLESGSERIKKELLQRPMSNSSVIDAFRATKDLDLMTNSFNMIGLPTETKEEVFATLSLNAMIMPDCIKMMTFYPFESTPIYDLCQKMKILDHDRKRELDNYQTATCLKFPAEHELFLKKVQAIFNWYINIMLNNEASSQYQKLVDKVEAMSQTEWDQFDFLSADKETSDAFRKKGIVHYTKFVNHSLAAKFPSKHFS